MSDSIGLSDWERKRREFTQGHKPYNSKSNAAIEYKSNPLLCDVEQGHFDTIYESIVSGKKFLKPMPLSFVMLVIVHGWRKEGLVRRCRLYPAHEIAKILLIFNLYYLLMGALLSFSNTFLLFTITDNLCRFLKTGHQFQTI